MPRARKARHTLRRSHKKRAGEERPRQARPRPDFGRAQKNAARRERRDDARACADLPSSTGTARNSAHAQHLEADGAYELCASLFVHQYRGVAHDKNDLHGLARLLDTILSPPRLPVSVPAPGTRIDEKKSFKENACPERPRSLPRAKARLDKTTRTRHAESTYATLHHRTTDAQLWAT
ncbi:hypothetical protein K438DRAFT_1972906 [Mycena galopus ATCC 62051]|nr:hypothetical protein K438DRAFT_1972906 [Mycena galopus ATCC 62051]